jgi:YHS domain-containing protein
VSAEANGGEVLLTGQTAALAPELEGVIYEPRGRRALRNVREPVELFAAVRAGGAREGVLAHDRVCRMAVDPDRAPGRLMYEGTAYFFCSLACAGQFARHPERFAGPAMTLRERVPLLGGHAGLVAELRDRARELAHVASGS